jgi:hypothetical protein
MNKNIFNREHLKLHLKDGIESLRFTKPDIKQAEHNFFEIANHLGIEDNEIVEFKCFRCGEIFEMQYQGETENLCKYCEEFDDENGELKV